MKKPALAFCQWLVQSGLVQSGLVQPGSHHTAARTLCATVQLALLLAFAPAVATGSGTTTTVANHSVVERIGHNDSDTDYADTVTHSPTVQATPPGAILATTPEGHFLHPLLPDPFISDVTLTLLDDPNDNGFYSRFILSFDVASDRYYGSVFARIYLRTEGGDYALFHTSSHFPVRAWPITDYYEIDANLLSYYGRDWYDMKIVLHDAASGRAFDSVDASNHYSLFNLPLEAIRRDNSRVDVVIHATAGMVDPKLLIVLAALLLRRRYLASNR